MLTRRMQGITLIELLSVIGIVALSASLALPSFQNSGEKSGIRATAQSLDTFVQHARSQAVLRNRPVTIGIEGQPGGQWCVGASQGTESCDCTMDDSTQADYCTVGEWHAVMNPDIGSTTTLIDTSADTSFTFEPINGVKAGSDLASNHHVSIASSGGNFGLKLSSGQPAW